eukprot:TRINITY_DN24426_c0_g1_i2.p1 TRINITY_DN24426_c0_g1~~TRINITY_DN24426_c0_g1_i2.p1  ORF type:complete len:214 (+),score=22.33 TRINITY_DN24426_c0_g1_i2:123-764(+)
MSAHDLSNRYLSYTGWTEDVHKLVEYIVMLAALDHTFLKYPPQVVAACSILLAHKTIAKDNNALVDWERRLRRCSRIDCLPNLYDDCLAALCIVYAKNKELRDQSRALRLVSGKFLALKPVSVCWFHKPTPQPALSSQEPSGETNSTPAKSSIGRPVAERQEQKGKAATRTLHTEARMHARMAKLSGGSALASSRCRVETKNNNRQEVRRQWR